MPPPTAAGQWPSPITARDAAAHSGSSSWPTVAGALTWWCSSDPASATVRLVRRDPDGSSHDLLDAQWSVRTRAIGYGGRPYAIQGDRLVFTEHSDGRIYLADPYGSAGQQPRPLTPPDPPGITTCYADLQLPAGSELLWCIREVTRAPAGPDDGDPAPRTTRDIVSVSLSGGPVRQVARSHHFLTNVRISPDGSRLAWIGWDHPRMPWDGTELLVATLSDGQAGPPRVLLGGPEVSVPQAEWAGPNTLYAMADPAGWWNLHRIELAGSPPARVSCVLPMPKDCAGPLWRLGASWFAVLGSRVVLPAGDGEQALLLWDSDTDRLTELAGGWTQFSSDLAADADTAVVVAASADRPSTVLRIPLDGSAVQPCTAAADNPLQAWLSIPERRVAQDESGQPVHYVWYPPTNPDFQLAPGELPPLLIHVHGGPTGQTDAAPNLEHSLFTSRGFAVASVDYGGSTGYGRAYRERLRHNWGVVDVADCGTVVRCLVEAGQVDPERVAIRGGSAGGWTSLACITSTEIFCAAAVYFPISDAFSWSGSHTHDFESRYLHSLIGRLPEDRDRYAAVSPLGKAGAISVPLVMLQGEDDTICRPVQALTIIEAVRARGLWHRMLLFAGEGHGFRKADSVADSLRAEAELYSHAMGLTLELNEVLV